MAFRNKNKKTKKTKKSNSQKKNNNVKKQVIEIEEKKVQLIETPEVQKKQEIEEQLYFLGLTPHEDHTDDDDEEEEELGASTHDLAEFMLYSFVDNSPHVADLLWTKQVSNQGGFLQLTTSDDHQEVLPTLNFSTHEPLLL